MEYIECNHLKLHNLKSISVKIPKNKFTVITGVSGSGKSTLVFDILDKVGQTKYLSAINMIPDKDTVSEFDIRGLSPTVCVSQNLKRQSNPRSTIGSRTGILSLLQELFAQIGESSTENIVFTPAMFSSNSAAGMCYYCYGSGISPDVDEKEEFRKFMISDRPAIDCMHRMLRMPFKKYCKAKGIDLKLSFKELDNDTKEAILFGDDEVYFKGEIPFLSEGIIWQKDDQQNMKSCPVCHGTGLRIESLGVRIKGQNIAELKEKDILSLYADFKTLSEEHKEDPIASHLLTLLQQRCQNLIELDLGYMNLNRKIPTLSGGEFQRLLMSTFFDLSLDNLVYVFDEPTLGLHESEKENILRKIKELSRKGNTILVVEHDLGALKLSDHIIELGPGGGSEGGTIIFEGTYDEFLESDSSVIRNTMKNIKMMQELEQTINHPPRSLEEKACIKLENINTNNLKSVNLTIPLNRLIGVVGVSGSGKSSLISQSLIPLLDAETVEEDIETGQTPSRVCLDQCKVTGIENVKKKMYVSQKPIGRNKKSMVASYIQIWDEIRKLFVMQALSENRKFTMGHFSFNSDGACEKCHGEGEIEIAGTQFVCEACGGSRYKKEVREVLLNGYNIVDILDITVEEATRLFEKEPKIIRTLNILNQLGLGYLKLGQSTKTISGGEAQRIKLAIELCKESNTDSLYVLDEPTAGLSCHDTVKLLQILKELVEKGNTVIIIEHDLQMITLCDWLIEMGPGSGLEGGKVIAEGSVYDIIHNQNSRIGSYCRKYIESWER